MSCIRCSVGPQGHPRRVVLADAGPPHWLDKVNNLQAQFQPTRFIVDVIGDKGAGKSSAINALLDEEEPLPVSCVRLCRSGVPS